VRAAPMPLSLFFHAWRTFRFIGPMLLFLEFTFSLRRLLQFYKRPHGEACCHAFLVAGIVQLSYRESEREVVYKSSGS